MTLRFWSCGRRLERASWLAGTAEARHPQARSRPARHRATRPPPSGRGRPCSSLGKDPAALRPGPAGGSSRGLELTAGRCGPGGAPPSDPPPAGRRGMGRGERWLISWPYPRRHHCRPRAGGLPWKIASRWHPIGYGSLLVLGVTGRRARCCSPMARRRSGPTPPKIHTYTKAARRRLASRHGVDGRLTCADRRTTVHRSGTCPAEDSNLRHPFGQHVDRSFTDHRCAVA
jgi:hypothetical protein